MNASLLILLQYGCDIFKSTCLLDFNLSVIPDNEDICICNISCVLMWQLNGFANWRLVIFNML